jgi:predicted naringenin-chalcone synthase
VLRERGPVAAPGLQLSDAQTACGRAVLRECGNVSSPSLLFVLAWLAVCGAVRKGDPVSARAIDVGTAAQVTLVDP